MTRLKQVARGNLRLRLMAGIGGVLLCLVDPLMGQVVVSGTVTDQSMNPIQNASLLIEHSDSPGVKVTTRSSEQGNFSFNLDRAGKYLLQATHGDYYPINGKPLDLITGVNIVDIELILSAEAQITVDVYPDDHLSVEQIAMSQALEEREIDSIPATRSTKLRIQGATAILPGVLRDPKGDLHFHGSSVEEMNWTLDGFSLSDPASGKLEMGLGAESVKSLDLFSGRYSAEFGKGTGGTMVLNSRMGDDQFRQRFTNFVPGIEFTRGLRFRDWRPRHNFSGPILKDRAWFFNSLDLLYEENIIPELPVGNDRHVSWAVNNSLRVQAKLTPRQTLSSGFVVDYLNAPKSGLSPLNPLETTLDRRARRYFFNLKDQIVLSPESILDFGYAAYRSINRQVPQGSHTYQITSFGRAGNFAIDTLHISSRDQWRANLFIPPQDWLGQHQLKVGVNLDHSRYFQNIRRTAIEYFRLDATRSSRLSFGGSGEFRESNLETAAYLQDRWAIQPRLVAELGLRWDWDRLVSRGVVTPRFGLAFMPVGLDSTKLSAGFGWIPATTYFRVFTRHRDQYSIFTEFEADGVTPLQPLNIRFFTLDRTLLTIPRTQNLSAGWQQKLPGGTDLNLNYLRKRMRNGYTHVPISIRMVEDDRFPPGSRTIHYQLQNFKRDSYHSVEISLSRTLLATHRWFLSYTCSRARSNAALDLDTDDPVLFSDISGRLPWDVPHRLVSWASFPIGKNTSVAFFAEWRDGFPFSIHEDNGQQVGQINSWRLPRHFNLNIHLQRELTFLGHQWSLRPGVDNVTNRPNYNLVNNNVASPQFHNLFGRSPRKLVVRLRWLGKAEN